MGKHSKRVQEAPPKKDPSQTLAWRGIGCLLILLVPAISIGAALLTLGNPAAVAYMPYELMGYPVFPDYFFATEGLTTIFAPIANIENLYAIIMLSVLYIIALGGIISVLYAMIYRMVNPMRYGPLDAPPLSVRAKKYKR